MEFVDEEQGTDRLVPCLHESFDGRRTTAFNGVVDLQDIPSYPLVKGSETIQKVGSENKESESEEEEQMVDVDEDPDDPGIPKKRKKKRSKGRGEAVTFDPLPDGISEKSSTKKRVVFAQVGSSDLGKSGYDEDEFWEIVCKKKFALYMGRLFGLSRSDMKTLINNEDFQEFKYGTLLGASDVAVVPWSAPVPINARELVRLPSVSKPTKTPNTEPREPPPECIKRSRGYFCLPEQDYNYDYRRFN